MTLQFLPQEVLLQITQYLRLPDLIALRQTCRAINDFLLDLKGMTILIQDDISHAMDVLSKSNLHIRHLTFKEVELQKASLKSWDTFWDKVGPTLETLSLHGSTISERFFVDVILLCPCLTCLHLNYSNALFMSGKLLETNFDLLRLQHGLMNLKELNLASNQYLNDALFNRLVTVSGNLEKLDLSNCQLSFHPAIYKRFYPAGSGIVASESVLTFQNVMKFVEHQNQKLKSLAFAKTNIDNNALIALSKTEGLRLEEIILASCDQLTEVGLVAFFTNQIWLCKIDMSFCAKLPDNVVKAASKNCTLLRTLNLRSCRTLSGAALSEFSSLSNLRELDLSACENVSTESIMAALCSKSSNRLISLNLSACSLSEETIVSILGNLKHLEHLDLSSCKKGVTDSCMQAICTNLKSLRTLKLAWCDLITDSGMLGMDVKLETPTSPTNGLKTIPIETITPEQINSSPNNLLSLTGLCELNLCACTKISDLSIESMFKFSDLVHLNLSLCQKLTDHGLEAIGLQNRSLKTLILSQCRGISDRGVTNMVKHLRRLQHLDLQGCRHLSDTSLQSLVIYCHDLRYLDVSLCMGVSQYGIDITESSLHKLTVIHRLQ